MNTNKPHDERQVYHSQTDGTNEEAMNRDSMSYRYVKHHGYAHSDFAEQGEVVQFNGIRVVAESNSDESEEFEDFTEMNQSDWTVNELSSARLNNGTILFEGQR